MQPVNVDGVRRLINASPEELSDDDIRAALVRLSCAYDAASSAGDQAEGVRRFAAAMDRVRVIG